MTLLTIADHHVYLHRGVKFDWDSVGEHVADRGKGVGGFTCQAAGRPAAHLLRPHKNAQQGEWWGPVA